MHPTQPFRIGHGFDLHRLKAGAKLVVGGCDIPHDAGCDAHSDGDVVLHAVTDAILGALALPDIGEMFPDSDPQWRGADSATFLKTAVQYLKRTRYALGNLDVTVILQSPKLAGHKQPMRDNLARLLGCDQSQVNIKAKTNEKADSLGQGKAIACHTVVLLERK